MIFSFSIIYFSSLKRFHYNCVLFMRMKGRCMSSILVMLQSDYGTNFNILFLSIFVFLKSLYRVPTSNSLTSAINNIIVQVLINQLLLIFKHYLYMSREHAAVCFTSLKLYLIKIKKIEQNISPCSSQKKEKYQRKWRVIENIMKLIFNQKIFNIVIFLFLSIKYLLLILHCVKSVRIRSHSSPYFPAFGLNMERYFFERYFKK